MTKVNELWKRLDRIRKVIDRLDGEHKRLSAELRKHKPKKKDA